MKLGAVTKFDKRNTATLKKIYSFFPIYGLIAAIQDSRRIVYKIYIFINSNLLPYKTWKQN